MARRTDRNQAEIVAALRAAGASVQDLHEIGCGCPDILIGYGGVNLLMEIKAPCGHLLKSEWDWHQAWRGCVIIVRSVEDALDALDELKE